MIVVLIIAVYNWDMFLQKPSCLRCKWLHLKSFWETGVRYPAETLSLKYIKLMQLIGKIFLSLWI